MSSKKTISLNGKTAEIGLSTSNRKTAHVLASSVKLMCDKYGIENVAFLTLTFRQHVTDPKEAQRRLNILFTHVIKPRYGDYVGVFERQHNGRVHYHLLVSLGFDVRTDFDFAAVKNQDYRSASPALRKEWAYWRKAAPKYGFGRTELMPIMSTAEGIGRYVGKYISKNIEQRAYAHVLSGAEKYQDKGVRLVRYSNGARAGTNRFMFVSEGSAAWRNKMALFAEIVSVSNGGCIVEDLDDIADLCGSSWGYHHREFILGLPDLKDDISSHAFLSNYAQAVGNKTYAPSEDSGRVEKRRICTSDSVNE